MGVPQPWDKSKKNLNYVREAGVRQFISTYNRVKDLKGDELLWGDEIEYGIFILDEENKKVRLSLRAKEVCLLTQHGAHPLYFVCFGLFSHNLIITHNLMCVAIFRSWTTSTKKKKYTPTKTRDVTGFRSMEAG